MKEKPKIEKSDNDMPSWNLINIKAQVLQISTPPLPPPSKNTLTPPPSPSTNIVETPPSSPPREIV